MLHPRAACQLRQALSCSSACPRHDTGQQPAHARGCPYAHVQGMLNCPAAIQPFPLVESLARIHSLHPCPLGPALPLQGSKLEVTMAQHLLAAADRFQLIRLRCICEQRLCETVEVGREGVGQASSGWQAGGSVLCCNARIEQRLFFGIALEKAATATPAGSAGSACPPARPLVRPLPCLLSRPFLLCALPFQSLTPSLAATPPCTCLIHSCSLPLLPWPAHPAD